MQAACGGEARHVCARPIPIVNCATQTAHARHAASYTSLICTWLILEDIVEIHRGFARTLVLFVSQLSLVLMATQMSAITYRQLKVPGAISTSAVGINSSGQIVGYYSGSSGGYQGFLLSGGKYTTVDYPNAPNSFASGINDNDEIV
jgi:hypothetical protein